jgi:hypothetical protein
MKSITKSHLSIIIAGCVMITLLSSCADAQDVQPCIVGSYTYGFWGGLWHGIISPFSFIGSLFDHTIAIYAVNNKPQLYALGFMLGIGIIYFVLASFIVGLVYRS